MGQRKAGKYTLMHLEIVLFLYTCPNKVKTLDIIHSLKCSIGNLFGKAGILCYLEQEGYIMREKIGKRAYVHYLTEKGRKEAELLAKSEFAKGLIRK